MNAAMQPAARNRRSVPLFVRMLILILGTVLAVQLITFAVLLLTPPPTPVLFTTNRVAAVIRAGGDPAGLLTIATTDLPPAASVDRRDRHLAKLLANDLGIVREQVRVVAHASGPPRVVDAFRPPLGPGPGPRRDATRWSDNVLFGSFRAAVRRDDGRWVTVQARNQPLDLWRIRILLWLLVALLVVSPIAWLLARRLLRPVRLFATAAERLGRDPRAAPLPLAGPPELREAARAFNEMQTRLNQYVQDRTTLIAAVAHDLRTPLMRLALRLEKASPELRHAADADIAEMSDRIGAAMAFVRDVTRSVVKQKLDLRSIAQSVTDEWIDGGHDVILMSGPPLAMQGDVAAIKSLLTNLVGNAVRYAGNAEVALWRDDDRVVIEVADDGPGMNPADLDRAFEPFFRGEQSRNRDTGGIGLGLASVRAVARSHGGDAVIQNRAAGGLTVRVTLPA